MSNGFGFKARDPFSERHSRASLSGETQNEEVASVREQSGCRLSALAERSPPDLSWQDGASATFTTSMILPTPSAPGWSLSTNTQLQSGLPLGISSGSGFGRPDLVSDPVLPSKFRCFGPQTCPLPDGSSIFVPAGRLLYFNPTAFRNRVIQYGAGAGANAGKFTDDIYWYGTSPRLLSDLRGWGTNITDLSVSRSFRIVEHASLIFRADVVNVFNHKNFSDGGLDKSFGGTYLPANPGDPAQLSRLGQSTSSTFGTLDVRSTGLSPRYFQFAVRVVF